MTQDWDLLLILLNMHDHHKDSMYPLARPSLKDNQKLVELLIQCGFYIPPSHSLFNFTITKMLVKSNLEKSTACYDYLNHMSQSILQITEVLTMREKFPMLQAVPLGFKPTGESYLSSVQANEPWALNLLINTANLYHPYALKFWLRDLHASEYPHAKEIELNLQRHQVLHQKHQDINYLTQELNEFQRFYPDVLVTASATDTQLSKNVFSLTYHSTEQNLTNAPSSSSSELRAKRPRS